MGMAQKKAIKMVEALIMGAPLVDPPHPHFFLIYLAPPTCCFACNFIPLLHHDVTSSPLQKKS